jgi:hypothetical protein
MNIASEIIKEFRATIDEYRNSIREEQRELLAQRERFYHEQAQATNKGRIGRFWDSFWIPQEYAHVFREFKKSIYLGDDVISLLIDIAARKLCERAGKPDAWSGFKTSVSSVTYHTGSALLAAIQYPHTMAVKMTPFIIRNFCREMLNEKGELRDVKFSSMKSLQDVQQPSEQDSSGNLLQSPKTVPKQKLPAESAVERWKRENEERQKGNKPQISVPNDDEIFTGIKVPEETPKQPCAGTTQHSCEPVTPQ